MEKLLNDNKYLAKLLLISALAPLAFALTSQYAFGLSPCELCIFQRIPFVVIALFALLAYARPGKGSLLIAMAVSAHAFLANAGISFYHIGVEKKWWLHGDCTAALDMSSIENLQKSLYEVPAVRCDEIQFQFLGLSMAGWNFVYCIAGIIITVYVFAKYIRFHRAKAVAQ